MSLAGAGTIGGGSVTGMSGPLFRGTDMGQTLTPVPPPTMQNPTGGAAAALQQAGAQQVAAINAQGGTPGAAPSNTGTIVFAGLCLAAAGFAGWALYKRRRRGR